MSAKKTLSINHIISFANVPNINTYLRKYQKAGFLVSKETVRHEPGLRNGFIYFGHEYIEFMWVEDRNSFQKKAHPSTKKIQKRPIPFGVAFESGDIEGFHKFAQKKGLKLPPTWSKGPRDQQDVIWWKFQDIPQKYLPGVWTFALSYLLKKKKSSSKEVMGKNTLYKIAGITFVTKNPQSRCRKWKFFLGGEKIIILNKEQYRFTLEGKYLEWITPLFYKKMTGSSFSGGGRSEIGLIHLKAKNISQVKKVLRKGGFRMYHHNENLFISPRKEDGFFFVVSEEG